MQYTPVQFPWRQAPVEAWTSVDTFVDWAYSVSDPRVNDWPLMSSFKPTLAIFLAYLAFIVIGKKVMANYKPFDLRSVITCYNVAVILLNAWLFAGIVKHIVGQQYNVMCNPVDYGAEGQDIAWIIYVYYLSKIVDLSDTVFMILRKKNDQASFLHIYHHGMMVVIWWSAVKWSAGGNAVVGPLMNTFIHFVMYSYYLAATYKITIPGKRYLTQMQMAQLFILLQHSVLTVISDCPYPHWTMYAQIFFMITLLILFGNFYLNSYRKRRANRSPAATTQSIALKSSAIKPSSQ